ncbi:amino acid aminotransferase [Chachezhania sediminis]|uniref:amino acid aminotransferase n=1 Tax=Chachezhania sediminis TaxID=2599291 RepID=UPI00131B2C91|nr:amino acid aminotransferase [Chachezhania sediminis]
MFEALPVQPVDPILALMEAYGGDTRPGKIDLGIGVYRNAAGVTPVMRAVKAAEERLWREQETKSYIGFLGDAAFNDAMTGLVLGDAIPRANVAAAATPGGTGAVRQAFEAIQAANPVARVFISDPSWVNHASMLDHLGLARSYYRYFDPETRGVAFDAMMADLQAVKAGDVVLLHGCCHNPTGADLNPVEWQAVRDLIADRGALAMIDLAYMGLGDGVEEDAALVRGMVSGLPECLIAVSCSKNFGLYRDRAGLLIATAQDPALQGRLKGTLAHLNRQNFSFPPDHATRTVSTILQDDALRADWQAELTEMRGRINGVRRALADELQRLTGSDRFHFLAQHRGMFSRLGATPDQIRYLRDEHAVYMVGDSRMNVAGLTEAAVPVLAQAIVDAGL